MEKNYDEVELKRLMELDDSDDPILAVDNLLEFLENSPRAFYHVNEDKSNIIHMCVNTGKTLKYIAKLCECDPQRNNVQLAQYLINEETTSGETPLVLAILKQRTDLIQYFIFNENCQLTTMDSYNQLPLSYGIRRVNTDAGIEIFKELLPYYSDDNLNSDGTCSKLSNELIELFFLSLLNDDDKIVRLLLQFTHTSPLSNKGKEYFVNRILSLPKLPNSEYCYNSETLPMFIAFLFHDEINNFYNDFLFKIPTFVTARNLRLLTPLKPIFKSFLLYLYYIYVMDVKFYGEFLPELMSTGLMIGHIGSPLNWHRFFQRIFYEGYLVPEIQALIKQTTIPRLHEFILSFLPYDIEVNRILFINLQYAMQLSRRIEPREIITQISKLINTLLPLSTFISLDHAFGGYLYEQINLHYTFTWFAVIHWQDFKTTIRKYCSQKYHKYLTNKFRKKVGVPTLQAMCRVIIRKACFMQEWNRCEYLKFRKIFELSYPKSLKEFLIFDHEMPTLCINYEPK